MPLYPLRAQGEAGGVCEGREQGELSGGAQAHAQGLPGALQRSDLSTSTWRTTKHGAEALYLLQEMFLTTTEKDTRVSVTRKSPYLHRVPVHGVRDTQGCRKSNLRSEVGGQGQLQRGMRPPGQQSSGVTVYVSADSKIPGAKGRAVVKMPTVVPYFPVKAKYCILKTDHQTSYFSQWDKSKIVIEEPKGGGNTTGVSARKGRHTGFESQHSARGTKEGSDRVQISGQDTLAKPGAKVGLRRVESQIEGCGWSGVLEPRGKCWLGCWRGSGSGDRSEEEPTSAVRAGLTLLSGTQDHR